ncbi:MAG TPA: hypothetical protein VF286_02880, partial [Acidiphilium sp.]
DEPWLRLAQSFRSENNHAMATTNYDAALERNPARIEAMLARGILALQHESPQTALKFLKRATEFEPDNHKAWHALGHACAAAKLDSCAIDAFQHAATLAPDHLPYAFDLIDIAERLKTPDTDLSFDWPTGTALALAGRAALRRGALDEAEAALEAARVFLPGESWIPAALGSLHMMAMRPDRAELFLRTARDLSPDDPVIAHDLAVALSRLYRHAEAEVILDAIETPFQAYPKLFCTRANQRASLGDLQGASDDLVTARIQGADETEILRIESSLMAYRSDTSAAAIRQTMETLGALLPRDTAPIPHRSPLPDDLDRSLRVGLLSNTLRTHPVGWLTLAGLEALDRSSFQIHCFGRFAPEDRLARRFAARADAWHAIDTLDDRAVAGLIAGQDIDILIDLGGYGDAGRMPVTAYRAAPVQIKWVGMQCATTGLREIDWFLTDHRETPDGFERFYTERLLRLDDGYVCYLPPDDPPGVTPLPALARNRVTFGCFNNVTKITDATLTAWAEILSRVPESRLTLRCPQFSDSVAVDRLERRAKKVGLDIARLDFLGKAPHRAFLAGYNAIDIALDPFPYSGGLTTCESLFMGVPVITLAGEHFAARHSVSHLSNVGLTDCIAASPEAYVERAVTMAADIPSLADLRARLRQQTLASPLCDAPRFGRNLAKALRFAWRDYCTATHT